MEESKTLYEDIELRLEEENNKFKEIIGKLKKIEQFLIEENYILESAVKHELSKADQSAFLKEMLK